MSIASRLIPLANRVLVKRVVPSTTTAGGVFLPDSKMSKSNEGEVMAIGPGARNPQGDIIPMNIDVGDTVLLPDYGGMEVKMEDASDFFLFREDEILGKISK